MFLRPRILLVALLAALLATPAPADRTNDLKPAAHAADIARLLVARLQQEHLSRSVVDDAVSARTWKGYIDSLDPAHLYFLQGDVETFRTREHTLDDEMAAGNMAFPYDVFQVFVERINDRCNYATNLVAGTLDLNRDETYTWDRKSAPWPRDRAEQDELWRRRVTSEFLQQVLIQEEIASNALVTSNALAAAALTNGSTLTVTGSVQYTLLSVTNAAAFPVLAPFDPPLTVTSTGAPPPLAAATNPPRMNLSATNATALSLAARGSDAGITNASSSTNDLPRPEPPLTPTQWVSNQYVKLRTSVNDLDTDWVLQHYLSALTRAYDPHCDYMSPPVAENFDIQMKLSLVGIGAVLSSEDGITKVVRVVPGGPADRDKRDIRLQAEDKIVAVAQSNAPPVDVVHMPLDKVVRLIRGEKGTQVVLTVIPASDPTGTMRRRLDLIRDEVQLDEGSARQETHSATSAAGHSRKIGLITLPAFYSDMEARKSNAKEFKSSSTDIRKLLRDMATNGVEGVILDLRNDGGGALVEAALVTGLFIPSGPVVQVLDRQRLSVLPDPDPGIAYAGPLIVLVNRFSASASEIVAAALQDYGRAVLVGDSKTHGKGSVQGVSQLSSDDPRMGSAKVTTALFFRINGNSTQLHGVAPDIRLPSTTESMEVGEEFLDNPMQWMQIRPVPYTPDPRLSSVIAGLAAKSEARRSASEKFAAYTNVLANMAAMRENKEVSLSLARRRDEARRSRELQERLRTLQDSGKDKDQTKDVVLAESLQIMADLIDVAAAEEREPLGTPEGP